MVIKKKETKNKSAQKKRTFSSFFQALLCSSVSWPCSDFYSTFALVAPYFLSSGLPRFFATLGPEVAPPPDLVRGATQGSEKAREAREAREE
jgi:hypothetical protein